MFVSFPMMLCCVAVTQSRPPVPLLYLKRILALLSSLWEGELPEPLPPLTPGGGDVTAPGPSSSSEESLYWIILLCWGSAYTRRVSF